MKRSVASCCSKVRRDAEMTSDVVQVLTGIVASRHQHSCEMKLTGNVTLNTQGRHTAKLAVR